MKLDSRGGMTNRMTGPCWQDFVKETGYSLASKERPPIASNIVFKIDLGDFGPSRLASHVDVLPMQTRRSSTNPPPDGYVGP